MCLDTVKCEKIYEEVLAGTDSGNYDLFELSFCFLGGYELEKLKYMLRSEDECIVSAGVFIANEIGQLAEYVIPELDQLMRSSDPFI